METGEREARSTKMVIEGVHTVAATAAVERRHGIIPGVYISNCDIIGES
jgi:hypothetical protein